MVPKETNNWSLTKICGSYAGESVETYIFKYLKNKMLVRTKY